ncbi:hypothetical protein ACTFIV_011250 [Dictyostelium citrinum]
MSNKNNIIKIIIVGEKEVGKSSLLTRATRDEFISQYIPTIGIDFDYKIIEVKGEKYKLQIWDYVSHDHINVFNKEVLSNTKIILFLFDLTNKSSFDSINNWLIKLDESNKDHSIQKVLVGTKSDLISNRQVSSFDDILSKLNQYNTNNNNINQNNNQNNNNQNNNLQYFEISSKDNYNVEFLFNSVVTDYLSKPQPQFEEKKKKQSFFSFIK